MAQAAGGNVQLGAGEMVYQAVPGDGWCQGGHQGQGQAEEAIEEEPALPAAPRPGQGQSPHIGQGVPQITPQQPGQQQHHSPGYRRPQAAQQANQPHEHGQQPQPHAGGQCQPGKRPFIGQRRPHQPPSQCCAQRRQPQPHAHAAQRAPQPGQQRQIKRLVGPEEAAHQQRCPQNNDDGHQPPTPTRSVHDSVSACQLVRVSARRLAG